MKIEMLSSQISLIWLDEFIDELVNDLYDDE